MRELRLLITDKCNYRCFFCHNEGMLKKHFNAFSKDDYSFLYKTHSDYYGNTNITVTGGEPLVRNDVVDILESLKDKGANITIVTNGSLLESNYRIGMYVDRINVSLHTTKKSDYSRITGVEDLNLEKVKAGIKKVRDNFPKVDVRFNIALSKGTNDSQEIIDGLLSTAKTIGASLKFIELYPKTLPEFVPLTRVSNHLKENGYEMSSSSSRQEVYTDKDNTKVVLTKIFCAQAAETVSPGDHCKASQDLFVTPSGEIKTCMNHDNGVSIYDEVKSRDASALVSKIEQAVKFFGKGC